MDVDVAAEVLAGSILTGLAFVVFVVTVVVINNILHKYWKPVTLWKFSEYPATRFIEPEEINNAGKTQTTTEVSSTQETARQDVKTVGNS
jgi:hypothetical protein